MLSAKLLSHRRQFCGLIIRHHHYIGRRRPTVGTHLVNIISVRSSHCNNLGSEMSAQHDVFKLSDYDCIGFDFDNTLCKYNVQATMKMEYEILAKFLVEKKNYNGKYLLKPIEDDFSFIKKGLMLDFHNGNVLQMRKDGVVMRAYHGTRRLTDEEIVNYYGREKKWSLAVEFYNDMLGAWNGPLSFRLRTLLDSFDMPASLAFARIVDTIDEMNGRSLSKYEIWPDVHEGLFSMYERQNFARNTGGYFPAIKAAPERFIHQCSESLVSWLKMIKGQAVTFLVTGSNADFASFVASYTLGADWSKYFDLVVCYARKPGFFTSSRDFLTLKNFDEMIPVKGKNLKLNHMYSQGNWNELKDFFANITGKDNTKCLYIGDNLIQDIYVPSNYVNLDTVAVVDNLVSDYLPSNSQPWLSYFGTGRDSVSIWTDLILKHSKICISDINVLCQKPFEWPWSSFTPTNEKLGFHPNAPSFF